MVQMDQIINMIKRGYNPQQLLINIMESQMKGTPMGDNLIKLAKEGNGAEIEKIARNMASQQGMDFDKEFGAFKQQLGF